MQFNHFYLLRVVVVFLFFCVCTAQEVEEAVGDGKLKQLDIAEIISPKGEFWKQEVIKWSEQLLKPGQFRWVEKDVQLNTFYPIAFHGIHSYETILEVNSKKRPSIVTFSFYNRGDANRISKKEFYSLIAKVKGKVSQWLRSKPEKTKRKQIKFAVTNTVPWKNGPFQVLLVSSYSKKHKQNGKRYPERYEYIKLVIKCGKVLSGASKFLKENVVKKKEGDIFIDNIPMVDQGQKGYCAVATVERVMGYYGLDCDQHQLAQLVDSSAEGGTNIAAMNKILRRAGAKLGIRLKFLLEWDIRDLERTAKKYDKLAKKAGATLVGTFKNRTSLDSILEIYRENPRLLTKAAVQMCDYKKFKSYITRNVDAGIPLMWALTLGIVPEGGRTPQEFGGHMRLIIGYNFKDKGKEEIIFSDSWGANHAYKRMLLSDAWAVTMALAVAQPR